jgi:hypothetical protein
LDLATKKDGVFLKANDALFQARFSPDGEWVVFQGTRLWIAPIRSGVPAGESEWIPITEANELGNKPRWSPDGSIIYHTSERDGFPCIWGQKVHPLTKRPVGPPFAVYHFHTARLSMMNVGYGKLEISVVKDAIIFNLGELAGNIWRGKSQ